MKRSLMTFGLLVLLTGSWAQHSVTQGPSMTASLGQTAKLSCTLGGGLTIATNRVAFFQQRFGRVPTYLLYYFTESNKGKGAGIPDRFVGSGSGSVGYLTINGVQVEDDADYYCASWTGSQWIFGGGTQLNVLSGETKKPSMSLFPPSSEAVDANKGTLTCLLSDFYPGSVTVSWTADGQPISSGVETAKATKQIENNLYMTSSYLPVTSLDWNSNKVYACQATHERETITASVSRSQCA